MQPNKETAPTPSLSSQDQQCLPLFQKLSITDRMSSCDATEKGSEPKTKSIQKKPLLKRKYKRRTTKKQESSKKKIHGLENKIKELEAQIDRMTRKMQCCTSCSNFFSLQPFTEGYASNEKVELFRNPTPVDLEQDMRKLACSLDSPRHSNGSIQFQKIDFNAPYMYTKEMDDRAWVYLGTMMIAMGSSCLDFDGTINVFKVLKESVDSLRRQVEKSQKNICMDFYIGKQEMKQENLDYMKSDELGFDPFKEISNSSTGLQLEGIKVQSVESFDVIYDSKVRFGLTYEALIAAMEYVREHCWLDMD